MKSNLVYIALMVLVTNLLRVIPAILFRKPIKNRFFRSFLYYLPYVTLAVMTVPAIVEATSSPLIGVMALVAGVVAAWVGLGLFPVALICCAVVFLSELFL